jgi:alpha-beta hydrolase superfamily lysophospholipase
MIQQIQHREGHFTGEGELNLYYQSWLPHDRPQAVLVLVHGLGSHSGTFNNIVQALVPQGYAIYGFDLRGHGRSPGSRGHINSWSELRKDLSKFFQFIASQQGQIPYFLLGHSLGAAIALDYALHFPNGLHGVIATALPLGKVGVPPLKLAIGQILSQVWPHFTLNTGIDRAATSRIPEAVEAIAADSLRHTRGSARLATEFIIKAEWLQTHAVCLQVPLLLLHGAEDRISPPEASLVFFRQVICADKERHEYAGGYHDIHDDLDYREMLSDLGNWLERHLEKKPAACGSIPATAIDVCAAIG